MEKQAFLLVALMILALFHFQDSESAVLYGKVGNTVYSYGIPKVSFIVPEDGSDLLVYQYPDENVTGEKAEVLEEGTRISYEFAKSVQPSGYAVRDKAINIKSV